MANRAFIIHGYGGEPNVGWRPWLQQQLEQRDWEVTNPAMPETDHPVQTAWVEKLRQLIGDPDRNTYLIGHSLGVTTILRYLESLSEGQSIGGAILVAGPTKNHRNIPEIENFFQTAFDWSAIKRHCPRFVALHSNNDIYVPVTDAAIYARELDANMTILAGQKHFSHTDGCNELPFVLDRLLAMTTTKP